MQTVRSRCNKIWFLAGLPSLSHYHHFFQTAVPSLLHVSVLLLYIGDIPWLFQSYIWTGWQSVCVYWVCLAADKQCITVKFKYWQWKAVGRRIVVDSMILKLCFRLLRLFSSILYYYFQFPIFFSSLLPQELLI